MIFVRYCLIVAVKSVVVNGSLFKFLVLFEVFEMLGFEGVGFNAATPMFPPTRPQNLKI